LWWTADPPRPFQLRPVPICSALRFLVAGLLPAFLYRRFRVYLKESRIPFESPLWYDRFSWQNPVRVTRPVPPGRCPFSSTLLLSGGSAFQHVRILSVSGLATFSSLPLVSSLATFSVLPTTSGFSAFSVLPATPASRLVGFCLTGELKLLPSIWIVKTQNVSFTVLI